MQYPSGDDFDRMLEAWVPVAAGYLQAGESVPVDGELLAVLLTLIDPGHELNEEDLAHPLIARVKAKFDTARMPPRHWVAWWGTAGERPAQLYAPDTEADARALVVSFMESLLRRDSGTAAEVADLQSTIETMRSGPARSVTWTDPFRRDDYEFQIGSCRCPDPDPSRCVLFKRAKQGRVDRQRGNG